MNIRKPYEPRERRLTDVGEVSRTQQHFRDECDVNTILRRFISEGVLSHVQQYGGEYVDVPAIDFQTAMNTITRAQEMFDELPAVVRQRFNNHAGEFLAWVQDPANAGELPTLGQEGVRPPPPVVEDPTRPEAPAAAENQSEASSKA